MKILPEAPPAETAGPKTAGTMSLYLTRTEVDDMPGRARTEPKQLAASVGERLAAIRKERGFTQVELAERLGITQGAVSEYERGDSRLTAPMLIRIADILGTSADEILGLKPTNEKRRPQGRLWHRLRRVENLPTNDRKTVLRIIDSLVARQGAAGAR